MLAGIVGAVLGARTVQSVSAAICRVPNDICRKGGDCCSGSCLPAAPVGRQRCGCSESGYACRPAANDCCGELICSDTGSGFVCNQRPVANSLAYSGPWQSDCIPIQLQGVDPDGESVTFERVNGPSFGRLRETDPPFSTAKTEDLCYKTNSKFFSGSDSFTYRAIDQFGAKSGLGTVQISVYET
jgi:hypothetical protein